MASNNSSSTDNIFFFDGLVENRPSKIVGIVLSSVLTAFAFLSAAGVIWFERFGSDLKRIFINKVVSSVCWSILAYCVFIQMSEIVFYFGHPLPELFCFFYLALKNALVFQLVLFLDAIGIVRYIFIFWMKNPLSFHDDFWTYFINCWVVILRLRFFAFP